MTIKEIILIILGGFGLIALGGIGLYLYSHTFVPISYLLTLSITGGIIIGALLFTIHRKNRLLSAIIGLLCGIIIIASGALLINYLGRDKDHARAEKAVIVAKFTEERHKTRRAGRRYVSTGEHYNVYFITLRFNDGTTKNRELPAGEYIRARIGKKIPVSLTPGLFSWDIYTNRY